MANAIIGALRVVLGIDAAEFSSGADRVRKKAGQLESTFSSLQANASRNFALIGASLAAAFGPGAIALAVRNAINLADETGKMAQSVGLSVESLSRLQYAAGFAGLAQEDLRRGVEKLTDSFDAAKDRSSEVARAYAALGIDTRSGAVANKDLVGTLELVADRFAATADGANKTAIAQDLFGQKLGSKFIPLLNGGAQALRDMAAESDALGRTLSTDTAKAAERFNDTVTQIQEVNQALLVQVADRVLPAFQAYADKLKETASDTSVMRQVSDALAGAIEFISRAVTGTVLGFSRLGVELRALLDLFGSLGSFDASLIAKRWQALQDASEETRRQFEALKAVNDVVWSGWSVQVTKAAEELRKPQLAAKQTAEQFKRAQDEFGKALLATAVQASPLIQSMTDLRNVQDLLMKDQLAYANMADPTMQIIREALEKGKISWQEYRQIAGEALNIQRQFRLDELSAVLDQATATAAEKLAALQAAVESGAISYRQYGNTVQQVERQNQQHMLDTATLAASTLTSLFAKNKAAAVASAIINTAVGVTRAFRDVPWPMNWVQAALVAAAGAAQIASIKSTSEKGGGATAGVSGSDAGGATPAGTPQAAPQQQGVFITLQGESFGREQVRNLITQINSAVKDGARLVLA